MFTPAPNADSSPPAPTTAEEKASPTRNKRSRIGFFAGGTLLGVSTGLASGPLGFPDWVKGWTFSDLDMSVAATPLATILSASGVIVAATIAFRNGEASRKQEREIQKETAKRETERSLRDRFFKITETLSEGSEYVKREAGVYALIALADDWAVFHRDDPDAAQREQQTCLNVITGQLRDPLNTDSSPAHSDSETAKSDQRKKEQPQNDLGLLTFKHRVQDILWERFRPSDGAETGLWSHLDLELSNCHLHNSHSGLAQFHGRASFHGAQFHGRASFHGAQFHGSASFHRAHFHGSASFHWAHFHGSAFFGVAEFHGRASFDEVEFHGRASFHRAHFHGPDSPIGSASFLETHFYDSASFIEVEFHGSASFHRAHFHGSASFHRAHFHGSASFNWAHFHGSASFNWAHFCSSFTWGKVTQDEGQISFKNVRFRAEKSTVLQEIDADISWKIVENAVFSAECPFDSLQSAE